ncbi:MAG TPA: ATP-binding protein [Anaerolineales bacterium]|nr:ATP-binding protein [Anaerolineales bacterium]
MSIRFAPLSYALRYVGALGLMSLTTAGFFAARQALDTPLIALLYLLPVGLSTALWGLGAGIAAALFAFLAFNFLFIEPYYTMTVHHPSDVVMLLVFWIVAVVISQLVGRAQRGMAAAQAREREATQLYELSTALAGLHDDETIARVLAERVHDLAQGEHLEISLAGNGAFSVHLPVKTSPPSRPPLLTVPIQAARGLMGEIRLWRPVSSTPSTAERRLLQTFASQGALALERARLAQAGSRARVLEESDRLKSAILSSVSHELRTPLSTIKAAVTSLHSGEVGWDSAARADLLAAIDEETDHLNLLVGNLLDMSRLESGVFKPQRQWNILSEIVSSVLGRMRRLTEDHRIELDIPEDLPLVPVDYVQMEQVFTNLLSNSLKYAPQGTLIGIHAHAAQDSLVLVRVSNQGPPVPDEHLERIFDKFYRFTAAERVSGIGLGLSICKGILEAHGGRIWAENLPSGFAFHFTLPMAWGGAQSPHPPPEVETG